MSAMRPGNLEIVSRWTPDKTLRFLFTPAKVFSLLIFIYSWSKQVMSCLNESKIFLRNSIPPSFKLETNFYTRARGVYAPVNILNNFLSIITSFYMINFSSSKMSFLSNDPRRGRLTYSSNISINPYRSSCEVDDVHGLTACCY